jgi:uncharacterized protein
MRFWDSSAVVPLLVEEEVSDFLAQQAQEDPHLIVWWATSVECSSALARLEREGSLGPSGMSAAMRRLDELEAGWAEVQPVERLRATAVRLLRVHQLRAADSLQLAAAIAAAEGEPRSLPILTLDERLAIAAQREGFPVIAPPNGP